MKRFKFDFFKPLIAGLISIALVTGAYFFGYSVGHENLKFDKGYKPTLASKEFGKPKDVDFSLFWDVWQQVQEKYAGDVDNQKMVYDAINGALASLDDPFTLFMPPIEAKRFSEELSGSFEGIGAQIEKGNDNILRIVIPLAGSPAEKSGIKAKDIILKINGEDATGYELQEAIDKIRGKKGTVVKLSVLHDGDTKPAEISVTRDVIVVKSVTWTMKDNNIAYIKIEQFGADTKQLVNQAVDELNGKKPKGIIIDVRNNPGGFLDSAVDITSLFVKDRGPIVKEKDKSGRVTELNATDAPKMTDIPMVVLTNGGSASASEIFAGALQDYGRAKLIGEKTYGKGSVQELTDLKGGSSVRITVAKWLTPKDRAIHKVGISPDIEVKLSDEDAKNSRDPQFDRAMQELNK